VERIERTEERNKELTKGRRKREDKNIHRLDR
jgi:hypothetical protein